MTHKLDRRDFIRRLLAVSAAGAAWGLAGCGSRPTPDAATPTSRPVPARSLPPTATAVPTGAPTAARAEAATPTTTARRKTQTPLQRLETRAPPIWPSRAAQTPTRPS